MNNRVHFIVALDCEARPLIAHFQLQPDKSGLLFKQFANEDMTLTVSGLGRINAACATVQTQLQYAEQQAIWINVGIAGHARHERGQAYLIGKLHTANPTRTWYPQILFDSPFAIAELTTVDHPATDYTDAPLYDMEAAGFYDLAQRCSLLELIHCIKIVSDNQHAPLNELNKPLVHRLIEAKLDGIAACVHALRHLQQQLAHQNHHDLLEAITAQAHFTAAQRQQLTKVLTRWQVLAPNQPPTALIGTVRNASQILTRLNTLLDEQPLDYGSPV